MPYVGESVAQLFDEGARKVTAATARDLCDAGGETIEHYARVNTPVRSGHLRSSWKRVPAEPPGPKYRTEVSTAVEYAVYVENGTGLWGPKHAKYLIKPKKPGGMLRFVGKDGKIVFARFVMHPGSPGNYMMAIATNVTEAKAREGGIFRVALEKWVAAMEGQAHR